ncbi:hypothetical protein ADT32_11210 [Xylella fastidiosa]|uniref:hypothetical protein n=1 Tax=Xylella fastidiosa TaxID=2371 RepID=UPI0007659060|nr:hypothetical protein [Xylella fastidiosa]KXB09852.1 hypothetical protein ADT32_11210 [Xylella fastidiosa]KXB12547.1 hypothetical protein ADT33_08820 [Xylella fastidiosa]KXB16049.1 hypothetical protein ADT31_07550 [Xylella fastidiosa]TNW25704.1 hypothetical protein EIP74_04495 [Xylella fastidiosa subsp. pauca]TNW25753.1 hypothetical protein EIP74_04785 [Xylella fastidiosa subsp. pauca]
MEEKVFVVVLHTNAALSQLIIGKFHPQDGRFGSRAFWICTHVDMENHYLSVVLEGQPQPGEIQTQPTVFHIPHSAVACVIETTRDALPLVIEKEKKLGTRV